MRRDRPFTRFWLAHSATYLGTTITGVVLPILAYELTGSATRTSLLVAVQTLPYLAFGLVAGAIADRSNRRLLMVGCELLSALLVGSIPVAHALGVLTMTQLYVVALGVATTFVWFDAANFGALPVLVGKDRLVHATSRIWAGDCILQVVGPALGGLLAATVGPAPATAIDAASYVASGLLLASLRLALDNPDRSPAREARPVEPLRTQVGEGLRFVWNHPLIRTLTLLGFGNSLTGGAVLGLLVVYADQALGLAGSSALVGMLYASGAIGALAASLLLPRLTRRLAVPTITLAGLALATACTVALALTAVAPIAMVIYGLFALGNQVTIMNGITYRQMITPSDLQGRVNVVGRMIAWGGQPIGAAAAGIVAGAAGVEVALAAAALGAGTALSVGGLGPLRRTHLGQSTDLAVDIAS